MKACKPITVVGGGLAGLTLGIGLRQRGIPVTVWEAGHYPRHRVCGEFISGRGQGTLARLGLRERLDEVGAISANFPNRQFPFQGLHWMIYWRRNFAGSAGKFAKKNAGAGRNLRKAPCAQAVGGSSRWSMAGAGSASKYTREMFRSWRIWKCTCRLQATWA